MGIFRVSRRELLIAGLCGGGALAVGVYGGYKLGRRSEAKRRVVPPREQPFAPDAFVAIDEQGLVTIWLAQAELGQGVATALPMLVAEELGADPARIRLKLAAANEAYGWMFTAVSSSVRDHWMEMRTAGAAAGEMLTAAAATGFGSPASECRRENGFVVHEPSGRRIGFGALVHAASRLEVPDSPRLKDPAEFRFIGNRIPRLDHARKVDGSARFGLDARLPGMAFAVLRRCPVPGGKIRSFDDRKAREVPGVRDVFEIERGVVVLGDTTHAAMLGRDALEVEFDNGPHVDWSSERVEQRMRELAGMDGAIARSDGDGAAALEGDGKLLEAEYRLPYLAHATMETMNCTADVRTDGCTIYAPTQAPIGIRDDAVRLLGMPAERVHVQPTFAGGGFGRRVRNDFAEEAILASKHAGRPVQVVWTREDDFAHDGYRPCSLHRMSARLDERGTPIAWFHRIITPSILAQDPNFTDPIDPTAVEGAKEMPYGIPNVQIELTKVDAPFPVSFWRSVGHSFNAFAVESFLDEIAAASKRDPAQLRLDLLQGPEREPHRAALQLALENAGEHEAAPGRGRGVALHASFHSHVAMIADVRVVAGEVQVDRVVAGVDCGYAIHPDGVAAQIEGAIAFALSAVFHGEMTFENGAAQPGNFDRQPLLTIDRMPDVTVHIVPRVPPEALGGVGEIGVPPVAPVIANAVYAATGRRPRTLPIRQA